METRTLGRTGLHVPVVGFGAMTIGGIFGPVDDAVSIQALHAAIDLGMRFIDTSDAYGAGHSERVIGRFLQERGDRDQIVQRTDNRAVHAQIDSHFLAGFAHCRRDEVRVAGLGASAR